ncbi:ATP-binding protein [Irregularibacter muris]|jgi:serine/threonine-protein kinase RsbW|uniref:ATP-binding protein n=1 Tax=Irregularibacter muris TaxID=1796619 RepID=A0AAE3L4F3_9FIRM|nr:ATP-binding protein [Irregularibacter muris]MCR1899988.1 ATP-binding protein [Irregularibacter muris]
MQEQINCNKNIPEKVRDRVSLSLPNAPEYVSIARLTLSGIANRMGFNIEDIEDLKVAIAEACTNALKHGCDSNSNYNIVFFICDNKLVIDVTDKGKGFDYEKLQQPDLSKPREGGLGIFIIRSLMDEVEFIESRECGTSIRMSKSLGEA